MEYINAKSVLPPELIEELQRYVQGGYLYIPAAEERHRCWGELSGYKEMLRQRNAEIIVEYENGLAVDHGGKVSSFRTYDSQDPISEPRILSRGTRDCSSAVPCLMPNSAETSPR